LHPIGLTGAHTMISVVVDLDDTLVDTKRRTQAIWELVLGREIPMEAVEGLTARKIFEMYASPDQRPRIEELRREFNDVLLCRNEAGIELLELDEHVPFASEVLTDWRQHCRLIYLTGRLESLRDTTLEELRRFGFPIDAELVMFNPEDWEDPHLGASLADARTRLFSAITERHDVARVVDDFPGYFPTYTQFDVPERIGLLRSRLYISRDYFEKGATRVVESWEELMGDPPRPRTADS
jgi:hypothetical protein